MYKNILVLDDGTEISAGKVGHNAVQSLTCTETVSGTTDLCPGAACANKLEITIWVEPGSALVITSGTRLAHYREDTSGTRTLCGTYWAVKPTRQTRNTYKIYAYDVVSKLDGIQSTWLRSIQGQFPMTLWAFAQAVAQRCGIEIANAALPRSGDYQVQAFYADDLTGRQLLSWVAQASCTFLRATPDGRLDFAWYTERVAPGIGPTAGEAWTALSLAGTLLATVDGEVWTFGQEQLGYFSGGLSYEDYETAPIDKVQIKQTEDDVGVLYPADETGTNALVIRGNLLLTTQTADALRPVAQAIYETMQGVTYTPMQVDIPYTSDAPAPGEIISLTDAYGRQMQTYVMSRTIAGQRVTLESTGNARRDSTAAVNEQKYTNLQGKVLEISANVDGLTITAKDLQGKQTQLELTVDGLEVEVSGKLGEEEAQTLIDQNLESITLSASTSGTTSTLTLKAGDVTLTSANITFSGMVTFTDLSTSGRSVINGGNITTGTIQSSSGNTMLNLETGNFRSGPSSGTRFELTPTNLQWAVDNSFTGILRSVYNNSWFGASSQHIYFGWVLDPGASQYSGVEIYHNTVSDSEVRITMDSLQVSHNLGVSAQTTLHNLDVWGNTDLAELSVTGSKQRIVNTTFGTVGLGALESPEPSFCDYGQAECDETGVCIVVLDPRFRETIANTVHRWIVTDVDGKGHVWASAQPWGAVLHGAAGQKIDWLCLAAQYDMAAHYAERRARPNTKPVGSAIKQRVVSASEAVQKEAAARILAMKGEPQ